MPPRYELNARFQSYVRRRRRVQTLSAAALCLCLLIGAGVAFTDVSPQAAQTAAVAQAASATAASFAEAVGATELSVVDAVGAFLSNVFHPPPLATSSTPTENWKKQPRSQVAAIATSAEPPSQQATSSGPVTLQSKALAPTPSPASSDEATASPLALSQTDRSSQGRVLGATTQAPIIERVVETVHDVSGATLGDLAALEARINTRISNIVSPPPFPRQVAGGGNNIGYSVAPPAAQRIDQLNNVTINNPTIVGGSISGTSGAGGSGGIGDNATTTSFFASIGHFASGGIDAFSSAAASITSLGTTELVATNATTTNLYVSGTARLGTGTGVLQSTNGIVSSIANGSDGQVLKIVSGAPAWGTDNTGSGGGSSAWATTTNSLAVYTTDPTQVVLVGTNATSTTGNILEVKGNTLLRGNQTAQGAITASSFTATSSNATSTFSGGLSVLNFAQTGSATSTGANGWNISAGCYAINNQCLGFSTLARLLSLSTQVTGTLSVANGGTGSTTLAGILKGNGTSQIATAVGGSDYEFPLTFNSPLSRSGNAVSLATSGDWSGTLGGYTAAQVIAAGFSTTSADAWKLNRDFFSTTSAAYWKSQTDFFATTSADAWKLTCSFFATTSSDYWLTQKTTDNLAQGSANKYYATSLFASDLAGLTEQIDVVGLATGDGSWLSATPRYAVD